MNLALDYAYENRQRMLDRVMEIVAKQLKKHADVDAEFGEIINCHHNYAAIENHYGENVWVHRKGAIRARAGEITVIPGAMAAFSVEQVILDLREREVVLGKHKKNDVAEECRFAYKDIDMAMEQQKDLVKPLKKLRTVGGSERIGRVMINEILLRRKNHIYIEDVCMEDVQAQEKPGGKNGQIVEQQRLRVLTMMRNAEKLGYVYSQELFEQFARLEETTLDACYLELVVQLKERTGADKVYQPMYPNFPEEVMGKKTENCTGTHWCITGAAAHGIRPSKRRNGCRSLMRESNVTIPMILDCATRRMVWCDISLNLTACRRNLGGNNLESNLSGVALACYAMVNMHRTNLYDLLKLRVAAGPKTRAGSVLPVHKTPGLSVLILL